MIIPNPLATKFSWILGSILFGGLVSAKLIGGVIFLPEFNSSGAPSPITKEAALQPFNVFWTATGGNVKVNSMGKYDAFCVPNPLTKLTPSEGSGAFVNALSFQMGPNPNNASYDISLEKSCNGGSGGVMVVNNLN